MKSKAIQRVNGAKHSGKGATDRAVEAEQILADHVKGMRPTELVVKYNVSRATIDRRIKMAVESRTAVSVDIYREKRSFALEEQMAGWQRNLEVAEALGQRGVAEDDVSLIVKATEMRAAALAGLLRAEERYDRLNGLDAPVKVDATVVVETEQERRLRDVLAAAKAEQAAAEAVIVDGEVVA